MRDPKQGPKKSRPADSKEAKGQYDDAVIANERDERAARGEFDTKTKDVGPGARERKGRVTRYTDQTASEVSRPS